MNSKFISWLLVTCSWQVISEQIKFKKRFPFSRWLWEVMNLIMSCLIHSNALVAMIYQKIYFHNIYHLIFISKIYLHATMYKMLTWEKPYQVIYNNLKCFSQTLWWRYELNNDTRFMFWFIGTLKFKLNCFWM